MEGMTKRAQALFTIILPSYCISVCVQHIIITLYECYTKSNNQFKI